MEDDADLREQLFHNTVRENIVSNVAPDASRGSRENAPSPRRDRVFRAVVRAKNQPRGRAHDTESECDASRGNPGKGRDLRLSPDASSRNRERRSSESDFLGVFTRNAFYA